ncbi:SPOSA6832_05038, partial [Sporobolomyces salmonicolor]
MRPTPRPPAFAIPDPFAPLNRGDADADDLSSASSDSGGVQDYGDDDEEEQGEKQRLVQEGEMLDPEGRMWEDRKTAQAMFKSVLSDSEESLSKRQETDRISGLLLSHLLSPSTGRHTFRGEGLKTITREHLANGTFWTEEVQLDWLAEAGDGVYSQRAEDGSILLTDINKNETRLLVDGNNIRDGREKLEWVRFKVSADLKFILFDTDWTKQWRHSSHANFWVHDIAASTTVRLRSPSYPPHTAFASFSPRNHHIAYVHANDLYVLENPPARGERVSPIRLTVDGSPTTFNGVPDWVFSSDTTTWWSPDASKLAFLSFDEELVPEYEFPIYNTEWATPGAQPYPAHTVMRYPKAGFPNPKVRIRVFDLAAYLSLASRPNPFSTSIASPTVDPRVSSLIYDLVFSSPFPETDVVVSEVTWVGKDQLIVKATDRTARVQRVALFDLSKVGGGGDEEDGKTNIIVGQVVRDDDFGQLDGGWAEPATSTSSLPQMASTISPTSRQPTRKTPSSSPKETGRLTGAVDVQRGLIYFIAAKPSIERHLYSVPLPSHERLAELAAAQASGTTGLPPLTALTNTNARGYYSASFSPFAGVYQLNYEGPSMPWQKLIKVDDPNYSNTLVDNAALTKVDTQFQHADISYSTVTVEPTASADGNKIELNAMELRPPLMDVSGRTKYPVLFQVYGGPNSQTVTTRWQRDWQQYVSSSLGYVVVRIDPRGTGFKGRRHRMSVRNRLGELEQADVIEAARQWAELPYVDEKRVGIWGWASFRFFPFPVGSATSLSIFRIPTSLPCHGPRCYETLIDTATDRRRSLGQSFGGFLTAKVIEANSSVFQLGMAVAPVTDWQYYDSIYTERYMSTPKLNPGGYANSSVSRMDGFKHADFALAHGSGDDNVHYQNTAALLDRFTVAHVRFVCGSLFEAELRSRPISNSNFRFRMFTDSDHSISMRGAYWELMAWLEAFLLEKFGEGGRTKSRWKMKVEHGK